MCQQIRTQHQGFSLMTLHACTLFPYSPPVVLRACVVRGCGHESGRPGDRVCRAIRRWVWRQHSGMQAEAVGPDRSTARAAVGRSKNASNIWVVSPSKGEGCRGAAEEPFPAVWGHLSHSKQGDVVNQGLWADCCGSREEHAVGEGGGGLGPGGVRTLGHDAGSEQEGMLAEQPAGLDRSYFTGSG